MKPQLLRLPAELIFEILGHLGSSFFCHDVRRLTVSKKWYDFAWLTFAKDLYLNIKTLTVFEKAMKKKARRRRIQRVLSSVVLSLESVSVDFICLSPSGDLDSDSIDALGIQATKSFAWLPNFLGKCPNFRSVKLTAGDPDEEDPDEDTFRVSVGCRGLRLETAIARLLSIPGLQFLEVDFARAHMLSISKRLGGIHFCPLINKPLHTLRRLYCRMPLLCQELLDFLEHETPTCLDEVIIDLSLPKYVHENPPKVWYSRSCDGGKEMNKDGLGDVDVESVEKQMIALAQRLENPKIVKVIYNVSPPLTRWEFDILTGKRTRLAN